MGCNMSEGSESSESPPPHHHPAHSHKYIKSVYISPVVATYGPITASTYSNISLWPYRQPPWRWAGRCHAATASFTSLFSRLTVALLFLWGIWLCNTSCVIFKWGRNCNRWLWHFCSHNIAISKMFPLPYTSAFAIKEILFFVCR